MRKRPCIDVYWLTRSLYHSMLNLLGCGERVSRTALAFEVVRSHKNTFTAPMAIPPMSARTSPASMPQVSAEARERSMTRLPPSRNWAFPRTRTPRVP
jgi:hypothetical protein